MPKKYSYLKSLECYQSFKASFQCMKVIELNHGFEKTRFMEGDSSVIRAGLGERLVLLDRPFSQILMFRAGLYRLLSHAVFILLRNDTVLFFKTIRLLMIISSYYSNLFSYSSYGE